MARASLSSLLRRLLLPGLAIAAGVDPPDNAKATLRERAWSSPIWYSPV